MMRAGFDLNTIRERHGRAVRALAVFFLLFTVADITLPQYFCGEEEIGGLPLGRHVTATAADDSPPGDLAAVTTPDDSRPGEPTEQVPHDEDCFCCCAHVLPGLIIENVGDSELRTPASLPTGDSVLSPPLPSTYHPPRHA